MMQVKNFEAYFDILAAQLITNKAIPHSLRNRGNLLSRIGCKFGSFILKNEAILNQVSPYDTQDFQTYESSGCSQQKGSLKGRQQVIWFRMCFQDIHQSTVIELKSGDTRELLIGLLDAKRFLILIFEIQVRIPKQELLDRRQKKCYKQKAS